MPFFCSKSKFFDMKYASIIGETSILKAGSLAMYTFNLSQTMLDS